jgi:PAS domain S-box-containing protein
MKKKQRERGGPESGLLPAPDPSTRGPRRSDPVGPLADRFGDILFTIDGQDGTPTFLNQCWTEYTGLPIGPAGTGRWRQALHPEDAPALDEAWRQAGPQGLPLRLECRLRDAAGSYRWFLWRASPDPEEPGPCRRWLGTAVDIHDLARARKPGGRDGCDGEQLDGERLGLALALAELGTWDCDLVGNETRADGRCRQIWGGEGPPPGGQGENLATVHPEDRGLVEAAVADALDPRGSGLYALTYRIVHPDGSLRWVTARGQALFGGEGPDRAAVRFLGAIMDITEQKRLAEVLRASEQQYQTMGDTIPFGVWRCDPNGVLEYASPSFLELLGLSLAEMRELSWTSRLPDKERQPMLEQWQHCVATGDPWEWELRLLGTDGVMHTILSRGRPIRDASGTVTSWVGINLDINERKRTEEALRRSQERLMAAIMASATGTFRWDTVSDEILLDPSLSRLLGLPEGQVTGDRDELLSTIHEEDIARVRRSLRRCAAGDEEFHERFRVHLPDGSMRWLEGRGRAIGAEGGGPPAVVGACIDVSDRKWAEEMGRQRETLQTVLDHIPVMLVFYDRQEFHMVNKEFERASGWTAAEASSIDLMAACYPDSDYRAEIAEFMATDTREWRDIVMQDRWGRPCQTSWTNVRIAEDQRVGIGIDISSRKDLEEQLRRTNLQLRRLAVALSAAEQRERRRIAGRLHDHLQQVLVATKLGLERLAARAPTEELRGAVGGMRELLDEAIDASRDLTFEISPPVLYEQGLSVALRWLARHFREKHELEVRLEIEEADLGLGEEVQAFLFQAIRELLFNTVKHAHTRAALLTVRRSGEHDLLIHVADDGDGCVAESLLDPSAEAGGFGLFSIQQRLRHLGGDMAVDTAPGRGFRVSLSLSIPGTEAPRLVQEARPRASEWHARAARLAPEDSGTLRVLIVDDHDILRDGLVRLLEGEPDLQIVAQAGDGAAAVDLCLRLRPDVVLMDVSMPFMDGIEATRRIRDTCRQTRVIALSMHDQKDMAQSMLQAGADDYVTKGSPLPVLLAAIRGD